MAVTSNTYVVGGSNQAGPYSYAFPIIADADIRVSVNGVVKTVTTHYTLDSSNTRITFTSGNHPSTGDKVIVYRDTDEDPINSTFVSGSTIRSNELNDNFSQLLYIAQESDGQSLSKLGGVMEGNLGLGLQNNLYFEGSVDDAYETTLTVANPTADRTITLPNVTGTVITTGDTGTVTSAMINDATIVNGDIANSTINANDKLVDGTVSLAKMQANSVDSGKIVNSSVIRDKIANDAVNGTKIADDSINSEHYVDASIDLQHLASNSVNSSKIVDGSIVNSDIANTTITGAKLVNDTVTATQIAANAITGSELANDAVDSEHYAADSIDTEHYAPNSVDTTALAADAVTGAQLADNAVNSEHYTDGSIDRVHLAADIVDGTKIADDAINSEHIAADSLDTEHYAPSSVDNAALASNSVQATQIVTNAVTTDKIADAELTTLAGMQSGTASKLAGGTALTADLADLNQIDGKTLQTVINDSDAQFPTSAAVVDYVAAQIAPIGGLEVIADEDNFPTQPASGVVISISNCDGIVVNGSGVCTTARTAGNGSDNVTINNFPASLRSKTLTGELGLMVSSTGSSNTYNYHKLLAKEADVEQLSQDINDFSNRYRVGGSNPSSNNDDGDLFFNTGTGKMLVYNASNTAWEEVQSIGNFYINTIASYSGTGGNSATFNGSAYRFVLSNAPTNAQQLIVSINGVVQKPNAGTSQPSEGFAIDGSSIIFSAAPATGSDYFIITCGSTVNIGTPSDNTVSTAKIQNLAVDTAQLAADAVEGSKIADDAIGAEHIEVLDANLQFADGVHAKFGTGDDLAIYHYPDHNYIDAANATRLYLRHGNENAVITYPNAQVELYYDNVKKFETTSTGATITGTLISDGLDLGDNEYLRLGTGNDLLMGHTGTDSFLRNDVGEFYLRSNGIRIVNQGNDETYIRCIDDGAVELYHNNVEMFYTSASGCHVGRPSAAAHLHFLDGGIARFGTGNDLEIYHNGTHNYIDSANGKIHIRHGTDNAIQTIADGAVELYYDNSKKFETTSAGVQVTGRTWMGDASDSSGSGNAIWIGDSNDLKIYHGGGNSVIQHGTTGNMRYHAGNHDFYNQAGDEYQLRMVQDGAVTLYHNGGEKLATSSTGIEVTGQATANGNSAMWQAAESGGATVRIQAGGAVGYCNVVSNHPLVIRTNDAESARFYDGDFFNSKTGYTGSFSTSTGNSVFGWGFYHNGTTNHQISANSYGAEIINCNNTHSSGGSISLLQYRTLNTTEGSITGDSSGLAISNVSDYRKKERITDLTGSLAVLDTLKPRQYYYREGLGKPTRAFAGFIAHELQTTSLPQLTIGTKDAVVTQADKDNDLYNGLSVGDPVYQTVKYSSDELITHLVNGIKELKAEVETLKTKVAALEAG